MREANFSIPSANKASVGITPALYDRRALDCTSTLPLINSLNNLAYLTTSSARIRDILTVDGGVERLVCILKEGRSKDAMESWKWNLAFQCVFNIGVRGSETVRTRVVEADMVPVVATVLENYIQAVDKLRKRADEEARRKSLQMGLFESTTANANRSLPKQSRQVPSRSERSRRAAPPPIDIPPSPSHSFQPLAEEMDRLRTANNLTPQANVTAGWRSQERPIQRVREDRHVSSPILGSQRRDQAASTPPYQNSLSPFGLRPVRDIDRLPSMLPTLNVDMNSQPQSPTTPSVMAPTSPRSAALRPRRRPSIRHQTSISGNNWENEHNDDSSQETSDAATEASPEPMVGIQNDIVMQDIVGDDGMLEEGSATPVALAVPTVNVANTEIFITPHRSDHDSTTTTATNSPPPGQAGFVPAPPLPPVDIVNATPPSLTSFRPGLSYMPAAPAPLLAALPRDEDVIMSLQLLAYVSKYCNLRSYFQQSHLVPRLKIDAELKTLDGDYDGTSAYSGPNQEELDEAWDNEFIPKPDEPAYNIFPLIEKFTVRCSSSRQSLLPTSVQHSETMQYWAGVVMRNLCRKDESRGGIRQCAYWKCGKWEEFTRQFAKCRRCRRTKYCSKECQKGAWGSHRFWCVAADEGKEGEHSRHHHHSHTHHHHHSHHTSREASGSASASASGRDGGGGT